MIMRLFLAACFAALPFSATPANAAPAACQDAWQSLPRLDPDPAYESPNDPDILYRDTVVRRRSPYGLWAAELNRATQNFVQVRGMLATWSNLLDAAERRFWADFDADGTVSQDSINELAYWLHKREVWSEQRALMLSGVNDQAAGALKVLFGSGPLSFLPPGEFPPGSTPHPSADIGASFANPAFRTYMLQLEQMSFFRYSGCAPAHAGTPSGRVLNAFLYPYYSPAGAADYWRQVQAWANAAPGRMEQLDTILAGLTYQQKLDMGTLNIIDDVMAGRMTSADDFKYARYSQLVKRTEVMDYIFLTPPEISQNSFSVRYTNEKAMQGGAIVVHGATLEQVKVCIADNWDTILRYFYDKTSDDGMALLLAPSMASIQYKKHIGYGAIAACGSAAGLDDPRVAEMIAPYANRTPAPKPVAPKATPTRRGPSPQ